MYFGWVDRSGLDPEGLFTGGGGGTSSQRLGLSCASHEWGESIRGGGWVVS